VNNKSKEPEPKTEHIVTVLSRTETTTHRTIGQPEQQMIITYVGAGLAPATIRILKDDYTLELEKATIKADIEKRLKRKAESYTV